MTLQESEKLVARFDAKLRALITRDPQCSTIPAGEDSANRPLENMLLGIKDNIETEKLGASAGSLALKDVPVKDDAFIVRKLREAGGLIYAKTNLSEWANFRSTRSLSGWSSVGGQTRNPHALDRSPCGSSSGSAAGVAAGYFPAAIGTETDGSIICPAAVNGLVGLKPTRGRLSRSGIVPIAESQDTAGPITRSVHDAALLLQVMEGEDERDPASISPERVAAPDPFSDFDMEELKGMNLGFFDGGDPFLSSVRQIFMESTALFRKQGAELHEITPGPMDELFGAEFTLLLCEFRDDLGSYLQEYRPKSACFSLQDMITFNEENREQVMPFFGQELFTMSAATEGRRDSRYAEAKGKTQKLAVTEGLEVMFKANRLDALLMPSNNPAWLIDPILGDNHSGGSSTLAAVSGWPSITVPMGRVQGLPVGLSIVGLPWQEARILGLARFFEKNSPAQEDAGFLETITDRVQ